MNGFQRHVAACNNAVLPGLRRRLWIEGAPVGWVPPETEAAIVALGGSAAAEGVTVPPGDLPALARALLARLGFRPREEAFDVRSDETGAVVAQVDRGALPLLGIAALGVHLNGLVERADGPHLWVGRRAANKQLDPGKLDHLVAGGVPAGLTPEQTLAKEAAEEAGLPSALVRRARPVAVIAYAMERREGLRRDRLHCYDLELPEDFAPSPVDGEVSGFELWPLARALDAVRDGDAFKFNVNLVLIDLFLRRGLIDPQGEEGRRLRAGLDEGQERSLAPPAP